MSHFSSSRTFPWLLAALFFVFTGLSGCGGTDETAAVVNPADDPIVILVSIDGARHDYPTLYDTPNLDRISDVGTRANYLEPVFPTKTFPNHYSLVTGLHPSNHGIVSNTMYDPEMDASFSLGNQDAITNPDWWGGEPLWVTAEQQGMTAATYFWPGSEAPIQGVRPSYWQEYDGSVPGEERVHTVLNWLDQSGEARPSFITLYFSEVDSRGHEHGPEHPEVGQAMSNVDGYIGQLLDGIERRGMQSQVDVIVTTDHGMSETSSDRVIVLDNFIDLDDVHVVDYSPVLMVRPGDNAQEVYDQLKDAHQHLDIYWRDELPEHLHFDGHHRIPAIIGLADDGWSIASRDFYQRDPDRFNGGAHGYDPELPNMRGIFYAQGPSFQAGSRTGPVHAIDVYEMITAILGLEPAENDGDLARIQQALNFQLAPPAAALRE